MRGVVFAGCVVALAIGLVTRPVSTQPSTLLYGSDGANPAVVRTSSLANTWTAVTTTARNQAGAAVVEKASRWSVVSQPAAGSQGTASIAAEAGVRHVVDCVTFSADASGGVTAAAGTFVVRDGATGAGTVIWSYAVAHLLAAAAGIQTIAPHAICGLGLVGTTNTAMTAEFNAGVTNEVQGANLSGYNVQ